MNECFSLFYRYDELRTIIKSLKNKKKIRDVSNVLNGNHLIFVSNNLNVLGYRAREIVGFAGSGPIFETENRFISRKVAEKSVHKNSVFLKILQYTD